MTHLRVMTYNVHRCVGMDGRDSVGDIIDVCKDASPDVVAMQELDAPATDQEGGAHHAREIAAALGMTLLFCRTFRRGAGYYGHALLSRHPMTLRRVTTFPSPFSGTEPRGAIWAHASLPAGGLDVISTHLGLGRRERMLQAMELLGERWLGSPALGRRVVLCGDLNAVPGAMTYRRLSARLVDAQHLHAGARPRPTFPSRLPLLRIDHVFVSPGVRVGAVSVPSNARSRRASDHLPLVVDLVLP